MKKETIPCQQIRTISIDEDRAIADDVQETSLSTGILKLLRNPMFHLISLSFAGFAMVVDPALTVIVDYLMDKGLKEDVAKYFISMMSLGDLIGRMGFGWVCKAYFEIFNMNIKLHRSA